VTEGEALEQRPESDPDTDAILREIGDLARECITSHTAPQLGEALTVALWRIAHLASLRSKPASRETRK
jgi:hypothetical protein